MMQTESKTLIENLMSVCKSQLSLLEQLKSRSDAALNQRPGPESWSALECVQHLNLYGAYYLPAIQKALETDKGPFEPVFKSGWLGNYFAESMLPKDKLNKMKTFKDKNPIHSALDRTCLDVFEDQIYRMVKLLEQSGKAGLMRIRIPVTISRWIRLRLGDTFRFVINHQQRHLEQALRASS